MSEKTRGCLRHKDKLRPLGQISAEAPRPASATPSQRLRANQPVDCPTVRVQSQVGTQLIRTRREPHGTHSTHVPPPAPARIHSRAPMKAAQGKRNHPPRRSGGPTIGDAPKTANAQRFRASAHTPSHPVMQAQGNDDMPKTHACPPVGSQTVSAAVWTWSA